MIGLIIWFLIGAAAAWRYYHGVLKGWYDNFNESYWDYECEGLSAIKLIVLGSPILVVGGLFSVLLTEFILTSPYQPTWWFTTRGKRRY